MGNEKQITNMLINIHTAFSKILRDPSHIKNLSKAEIQNDISGKEKTVFSPYIEFKNKF